jgi:hypothetical protein
VMIRASTAPKATMVEVSTTPDMVTVAPDEPNPGRPILAAPTPAYGGGGSVWWQARV